MRIDQFITGDALDRVVDVLVLVALDGSLLDANDAALECYGYSRDEMLGLTIGDIRVPKEDDNPETHRFSCSVESRQVARGGAPSPGRLRVSRRGSRRHRRGPTGRPRCSAPSVTSRIAGTQRQRLRESEAKHSSMISNISDVIGIMGVDGVMKYKSPNIEKWFGWHPGGSGRHRRVADGPSGRHRALAAGLHVDSAGRRPGGDR